MTAADPITPITAKLIELLAHWPRQRVAELILDYPEAAAAVLNGEIRELLGPVPGNKQPYGWPAVDDSAVGFFDESFPQVLRTIPDPPLVLFYEGRLALLGETSIAVVGARKCTSQGKLNAETLARELAALGVHIVSGLALGIDGAAHKGALAAGGAAQTIAVLGAGLQQVYPQRHRNLARQIVTAGGLLVSEYPASKGPRPYQFPERNRLISGVSLATVVVEAGDRSGSLITARFAAEQGRDVMAMPGPVQSFVSNGCHRLIQQGAGLVTDATQVIANAGIEQQALPRQPAIEIASVKLSDTSQQIVNCLQGYAVTLDELLSQTQIPTRELTCALVELELLGFVQQGPLGYIRMS